MALSATGNSRFLNDGGFALVELLVVLAIAALLTTIAVRQSPGTRARLELQSTANSIVADLVRARIQAIGKGVVNDVDFDEHQHRYTISLDGTIRPLPEKLRLEMSRPLQRSTERLRISFFPDGTATAAKIDLLSDDRQKTILVNWLTGRASAYD